jgi:hypothetical protein
VIERDTYNIDLQVTNYKSYYGQPVGFQVDKPFTLLVGPNGEGKSGLIQSLLLSLDGLIRRSNRLRSESLWTEPMSLLPGLDTKVSMTELVLGDLVAGAFSSKSRDHRFPRTMCPMTAISEGKRKCTLEVAIKRPGRKDADHEVVLAKSILQFERHDESPNSVSYSKKNEFKGLDLIYLPSDGPVLDVFPAFVHQLFNERYGLIEGASEQSPFLQKVLGYYSRDQSLVKDFRAGRINEPGIREKMSDAFLAETLPTGVKLELLLYLLPLILDRNKDLEEWMAVILVDELGGGLHLERQGRLSTEILDAFNRNSDLASKVRVVATTHSPMVYSSLSQRTSLVDTVFVVRKPGEPSKPIRLGDEWDDYIDEMMKQQLWLDVLKLNNAILFVEGKTDKWFFEEVFRPHPRVQVLQMGGANLSAVLADVMSELEPAPKGEYFQLVEKGMEERGKANVDLLRRSNVKLKLAQNPYESIEELMCGFEFKGQAPPLWKSLLEFAFRVEEVSDSEKSPIDSDSVVKAERSLRYKKKDGFDSFIGSWKGGNRYEELYRFCGEKWPDILGTSGKKSIAGLIKKVCGSSANL